MRIHLQRDIDRLQREILSLSAVVEEMIDNSIRALVEKKIDLAQEVIDTDTLVNKREVAIEEECLKTLALHQPVAVDLRRIATVMKVNGDLERIGDLAVNIAERAQCLDQWPLFPLPTLLPEMAAAATDMVRDAMNAFVKLDAVGALELLDRDDVVDNYNRAIIEQLEELVEHQPHNIKPALHCFSTARHIERIADHATNIAEDVIYLVEGRIIRHQQHDQVRISQSP